MSTYLQGLVQKEFLWGFLQKNLGIFPEELSSVINLGGFPLESLRGAHSRNPLENLLGYFPELFQEFFFGVPLISVSSGIPPSRSSLGTHLGFLQQCSSYIIRSIVMEISESFISTQLLQGSLHHVLLQEGFHQWFLQESLEDFLREYITQFIFKLLQKFHLWQASTGNPPQDSPAILPRIYLRDFSQFLQEFV